MAGSATEGGEDSSVASGSEANFDLRKEALNAAASAASRVDTEADILLVRALRDALPGFDAKLRRGPGAGLLAAAFGAISRLSRSSGSVFFGACLSKTTIGWFLLSMPICCEAAMPVMEWSPVTIIVFKRPLQAALHGSFDSCHMLRMLLRSMLLSCVRHVTQVASWQH